MASERLAGSGQGTRLYRPEAGTGAYPDGIYDIADNKGWVSVGTDHDTASFAVHAIGRWWLTMGQIRYPNATRLLVTADGGGSNGHRVRLWKVELQTLANTLGVPITVCHLPPGTSKWSDKPPPQGGGSGNGL